MSGSMLNLKNVFSFVAGSDVVRKSFVEIRDDGKVYPAGGAGGVIGVSDLEAKAGGAIGVATAGIAQIRAGGDIEAGSFVTFNATGAAVKASADSVYEGVALIGVTQGALVSVLLKAGKTVSN